MENYYTPQEIAERLKIDIRTLYRWIREGRLKAVKIGHFWRVAESELKRFLQSENQGSC
jgi:excisionase family DNA binding protein